MKNKKNKVPLIVIALCGCFAVFFAFSSQNTTTVAHAYSGSYGIEDFERCKSVHINCNCGSGRESGYNGNADSFLNFGCRNYNAYPYWYNYNGYTDKFGSPTVLGTTLGVPNVPFWINQSTMNAMGADPLKYEPLKQQLVDLIRTQAALWSSTMMHDGTGQIINLYEPNPNATNLPVLGSGHPVCEISREDIGDGVQGVFRLSKIPTGVVQISLSDSYTACEDYGLTPLHEMGHMLGLNDLDSTRVFNHKVCMGYDHNGLESLCYQDIQGLAIASNRHTVHDYKRYIIDGDGDYLYFCFYCDIMNVQSAQTLGGSHMTEAPTCEHNYLPIVSVGDAHWQKCTKCYKVIECEFLVNYLPVEDAYEIVGLLSPPKSHVIIPTVVDEKAVIKIGNNAFSQTDIAELTIPWTVTEIDDGAFSGCSSLERIMFRGGSSLQRLGNNAFSNCTSLIFPASLFVQAGVSIGNYAFEGCLRLGSVVIPERVTSIGLGAFYDCRSIYSITLPFVGATKNGSSNTHFTYIFGAPSNSYSPNGYIPDLRTVIINGGNIANAAFAGCSLITRVDINKGVTGIGNDAFAGCSNLGNVTFESESLLTSIGDYAFNDCGWLTYVAVPAQVATVGSYAFRNCGSTAFASNGTKSTITFGSDSLLQSIGVGAFKGCNLQSLTIPFVGSSKNNPTYTHLGYLFDHLSYTTQVLPPSLKTVTVTGGSSTVAGGRVIGTGAFYGCSNITGITMPSFCRADSVASILFYRNPLQTIEPSDARK